MRDFFSKNRFLLLKVMAMACAVPVVVGIGAVAYTVLQVFSMVVLFLLVSIVGAGSLLVFWSWLDDYLEGKEAEETPLPHYTAKKEEEIIVEGEIVAERRDPSVS